MRQISLLRIAHRHMLRHRAYSAPLINDWRALQEHLYAELAYEPIEHFRVIFLNTRRRLIRDETMSVGSIDHTAVYVREVIKRALELSAASLILVHNHPGGSSEASTADRRITRDIVNAGNLLDVAVLDHIILSTDGYSSLRAEGWV